MPSNRWYNAALIGARLLAVYLFVSSMMWLSTSLSSLIGDSGSSAGEIGRMLVPAAIEALAAAALWFGAGRVATEITLDIEDEEAELPARPPHEVLTRIGTALIGLHLAATALPGIAYAIAERVTEPAVLPGLVARAYLLQQLAGNAMRLIVGVALILGSARLAALIERLRPASARTQ